MDRADFALLLAEGLAERAGRVGQLVELVAADEHEKLVDGLVLLADLVDRQLVDEAGGALLPDGQTGAKVEEVCGRADDDALHEDIHRLMPEPGAVGAVEAPAGPQLGKGDGAYERDRVAELLLQGNVRRRGPAEAIP